MNKEKIIEALKKLEQSHRNPHGYNAKEILSVLNIEINRKNEKQVRGILRSMISKWIYPEFATAGNEDILYCPNGKGTGRYRLIEYRLQ